MKKQYQLIKKISIRDSRLALFDLEDMEKSFISLLMGIRCGHQISPNDFPKYKFTAERIVIAIPASKGSIIKSGNSPTFALGDEIFVGYWINKRDELFPSITQIEHMALNNEKIFRLPEKNEIVDYATELISGFYE